MFLLEVHGVDYYCTCSIHQGGYAEVAWIYLPLCTYEHRVVGPESITLVQIYILRQASQAISVMVASSSFTKETQKPSNELFLYTSQPPHHTWTGGV